MIWKCYIDLIIFGKVIDVNELHTGKVDSPFDLILLGRVISCLLFIKKNSKRHIWIEANKNERQTIEEFAFYRLQIKEIFISSRVSKIYEYAFYDCSNLKKVEF